MKRILPLIIAALLLFSISGCLTQSPSEFAAENQSLGMSGNEQAITNACLQWVQTQNKEELVSIQTLSDSERGESLRHKATMDMIKNTFGKGNECKPGTNQWDAYVAYVKEVEQSHRQYSSDAKSVATLGIVTTGAVKLADSLMGAAGDKINNSGAGAQISTNKEDNDNVAIGNDKGNAEVNNDSGGKSSGICNILSAHLADCRTTTAGPATPDEYNACLIKDYGYSADEIAKCPQ